ncbi:MAG: MBL fold metallo-hydrolase, partial [Promethearchaeota archaeon]
MTAIREPGKVTDNITLIDFHYEGVAGVGGVYLIEAGKNCLIDSGSRDGAPHIIKTLKELNVFPPDIVIITHSHWDHSQGLPLLRKKAQQEQKSIEVYASEKAIPLLEDQSYNEVFKERHFENIRDVSPLKEGDIIDLEGVTLKTVDVPGHSKDHIALLDEENKNIFLGDSIGIKIGDNAFLSPIMPPFWNKDDYYTTLEKLTQLPFDSACLDHFGYIYGDEAKSILDESRKVTDQEWQIYEIAEENDKLDDLDYLADLFMKKLNPIIPELKIEKYIMRNMLRLINTVRKIVRKEPIAVANILLKETLGMKVKGYKIAKG